MMKDMSNAYLEEHMRLKEFGNTLKATKTLITTQVGQLKKDRALLQKQVKRITKARQKGKPQDLD